MPAFEFRIAPLTFAVQSLRLRGGLSDFQAQLLELFDQQWRRVTFAGGDIHGKAKLQLIAGRAIDARLGRLTKINGIHVSNIRIAETGIPFRIEGDKREPVTDVTLDNITIGKVRGKKNDYRNAEGVKESNITIGELLPADGKKK